MKRSLIYLGLVCLIPLSANPCNAQTNTTGRDETTTQAQTEADVCPGIMQAERRQILKHIRDLQSKGVGISSYMAAFNAIETQVENGTDENTLKGQVERLRRAVDDQSSAVSKARSAVNQITAANSKGGADVVSATMEHRNESGSLGGTTTDSSMVNPYTSDLQRRIKKHWFPPKNNESKIVVVKFRIHRQGELDGLHLVHTSGVSIADNAALKAVEDAAPFRPLPSGSPEIVEYEFTFNYNLFNGTGNGVVRLEPK